ncbi:MAG: SagB/ThcOx family dehydrogenase [Alphaproteobacteria bacterium]|jgi:SagB-type dehydrogenase family enzyme|nr:SagB/ThcOx family dehydrogenase [Alphaproteobacteria bacterium]
MADPLWTRLLTPDTAAPGWELFHENSKLTRFSDFLPDEEVRRRMAALWQTLPSAHAPPIGLPGPDAMAQPDLSVTETMRRRRTPDNMTDAPLALPVLAALLWHMAGADPDRGQEGRPFRLVPSGGALYPLEPFVHVRRVEGVGPGLYYYNPLAHALHPVGPGDRSAAIAETLVQPGLVEDSAIQVFQTALFGRATFKYGDRGYRFALMEAGHQAQNLNLMATALGLGCIHVGGYRDHAVDTFLGLDGIGHSTVYLAFVGTPEAADAETPGDDGATA